MTRLLRDTLEEWAGEARVPHDLADRALGVRRPARAPRGRVRPWALVAGAVALATGVTAALVVPGAGVQDRGATVRPATGLTLPERPSPAPTDIRTYTEGRPPRTLIAAGNVAVSAYWTTATEKASAKLQRFRRTWWLYDPRNDGYEKTDWTWVDVAPGLRTAAAISGGLLGRQIVIVDMATRRNLSVIGLEHDAGSLVWSPDGTKLLVTTYSDYPDQWKGSSDSPDWHINGGGHRTGYYLIDVTTGEKEYHPLPALSDMMDAPAGSGPGNSNSRQDLGWSLDGSLIWAPTNTTPDRLFYTLDGKRHDPPADRYIPYTGTTALSPDGKLVIGPRQSGLPTEITDAESGKVVGRQRVLQLLAWADDDNVVALGCARECDDEFDNGLVLVSVDGTRTTQLAATGKSDGEDSWRWVLTPR
ncbi:hypothetical protein [Nonomuraea rhodomycinica]|uniref:WD40-like Beta Propeller Repeat n=1 Tax=Nonomuraea rhodomycinica TaxID=1712872 RepID=A0A7Y6ITF9_9ACTN|nr:hypothetical protein [Nonomuraea rhodomycinica]NUW43791.1 hypothetical protein [Nonomuraea rhodomycinica]